MDKVTKKDSIIGKRIRRFRRKAELTQEELSEKVNVSTTHVGLVETGYRRMSLKTLQKVAKILKIKVKDLIPY
ncbi:MAG: helix-turn-helix transcriptional regulator [Patescibacteria group bacterium]